MTYENIVQYHTLIFDTIEADFQMLLDLTNICLLSRLLLVLPMDSFCVAGNVTFQYLIIGNRNHYIEMKCNMSIEQGIFYENMLNVELNQLYYHYMVNVSQSQLSYHLLLSVFFTIVQ